MHDDSETEARLERLYAAPRALDERDVAHRRVLEEELLAAIEGSVERPAKNTKKERPLMKNKLFRRSLIVGAVAAVLGVVACAAPADVDVDVGRSISIRYDANAPNHPEPKEVAEFLRKTVEANEGATKGADNGAQGERQMSLRVMKQGGVVAVDAEIWGGDSHDEALAPRIRQAFPALASAEIKEEILHGKVHGSFAKKVGHDMLSLNLIDHTDVETARQQVMDQLRAQGVDGDVDVQVEDSNGERKVIVNVQKEEAAPEEN